MPSKAVTKPKSKTAADHVSYQDMIIDAIVTLKERNGSSRVALKKYIKANHKNIVDGKMFDSLFNRALKSGVEKGIFAQPRGASGGTKLAKKVPKTATTKPSAKSTESKPTSDKKTVEKKSATKKTTTSKKATTAKSDSTSSTKTAKPKAPSKSKKASTSEKPAILGRTKSGRVTKATPGDKKAPKKKTLVKKTALKKAS